MSDVAAFFLEMETIIANNRAMVAAGKDFEMKGFEQKIERLCDMVLALSPEERPDYEQRMRELLETLNCLGLEMKAQVESIKDLPVHRNANVAYKKADARDNFGKREEG